MAMNNRCTRLGRGNRAVGDLFWAAGHMGASVLGSTRTSNRTGDEHLFIHC